MWVAGWGYISVSSRTKQCKSHTHTHTHIHALLHMPSHIFNAAPSLSALGMLTRSLPETTSMPSPAAPASSGHRKFLDIHELAKYAYVYAQIARIVPSVYASSFVVSLRRRPTCRLKVWLMEGYVMSYNINMDCGPRPAGSGCGGIWDECQICSAVLRNM